MEKHTQKSNRVDYGGSAVNRALGIRIATVAL